MNYQLKKIVLWRSLNPALVGLLIVGLAVGGVGAKIQSLAVMGAGGLLATAAIALIAKPVISLLLLILGFMGGILTFFVLPTQDMEGMLLTTKLLATGLFSLLYMALLDLLVMIGAVLYGFLIDALSLEPVHLEIAAEEAAPEHVEEAAGV